MSRSIRRVVLYAIIAGTAVAGVAIPVTTAHQADVPSLSYPDEDWPPQGPETEPAPTTTPPPRMGPGCPVCL